MNSVLFFDWGGGNRKGGEGNVSTHQNIHILDYEYIVECNIGERTGVGGRGDNRTPKAAVVKYTNPPKQGNIITISKTNKDTFLRGGADLSDCGMIVTDFIDLYVVFSLENNINILQGYTGVTYKVNDRDDFSVSFDTEGKNYNVFIIYDNLLCNVNNWGNWEDPPTCSSPYGYVTFYRFS